MPNKNFFSCHEEYLEYYRKYRELNKEKLREYRKRYNKEWRKKNGYHNEIKWAKDNPEKVKAKYLLNYAVKKKMIVRRPCAICESNYRIQGHHPDYSKPLEVVWLCALHHKEIHINSIWERSNNNERITK